MKNTLIEGSGTINIEGTHIVLKDNKLIEICILDKEGNKQTFYQSKNNQTEEKEENRNEEN